MKKKIALIVCLFCGILGAEEIAPSSNNFEIGKWKEFIGVNIGAGLYDINEGYIISINNRLFGASPTRAFGGNIAITTGKQKYTYEKVGWRYLFILRVDYMDGWKYKEDQDFHLKSGWGLNATVAIDGMFDFIRENNSSFGMILGLGFQGFDLKIINRDSKNAWGVTAPLAGEFRIGFKGQFDNNVLDCVLSIPYVGVVGLSGKVGFRTFSSTTLTLGYQHLF